MPREQAFPAPAPRLGGLLAAHIGAASFTTTGEDTLRIVSFNSLSNVRLNITARRLSATGEILSSLWTHTPNTDRTVKFDDFPLVDGALLNVAAIAAGAQPKIGQTYALLVIVRGIGTAATLVGAMAGGYVTAIQPLGWPGSSFAQSVDGNVTARQVSGQTYFPGQEVSEVVPTGARWELLRMAATLTTSAAAGVRTPRFRTISGGNVTSECIAPAGVNPSTTTTFTWAPNIPALANAALGDILTPAPSPMLLFPGESMTSRTDNFDVADHWVVNYTVREWLEGA